MNYNYAAWWKLTEDCCCVVVLPSAIQSQSHSTSVLIVRLILGAVIKHSRLSHEWPDRLLLILVFQMYQRFDLLEKCESFVTHLHDQQWEIFIKTSTDAYTGLPIVHHSPEQWLFRQSSCLVLANVPLSLLYTAGLGCAWGSALTQLQQHQQGEVRELFREGRAN